jgi:acetylornithine deacetylase/succinyl-diaminopimelate desuccinylase-like protein
MEKDGQLQKLFDMVDETTDELVALHQELVRIPSINTGAPDSGNETEVCRLLEKRFNEEGITNLTLESAPDRGNFIAHMGDKDSPRLIFMTHNDVVPIEDESKWDYPPFSGKIVDGKIYGRGSEDCKSLTTSGTMAMILLKRAGVSLTGELRFVAAADEESGGNYGIKWLAENHPDKIRADWAINEGGGMPIKTVKGQQAYLFPIGEKGRIEARFSLTGRSAHGARPWYADNALYKMAELLKRLQKYQDEAEIDLSVPVFNQMNVFGVEGDITPETIDPMLNELEKTHQALARELKGMSRISVTPTITAAGAKSNSIPSKATLICDVRTLPNHDETFVRKELDKLIEGMDDVGYELDVWAISNSSPSDSPFVGLMKQATELLLEQEIHMIPCITIGFTDSRCVRPLGAEVYGYTPLTPDSDTNRTGIHGINEAMEISNLVFRTKLQVALAYLALNGRMA